MGDVQSRVSARMRGRFAALFAIIIALVMCAACASMPQGEPTPEAPDAAQPESGVAPELEGTGDIYILYTSDVHCGVDDGFGYAGVQQIRDSLEARGYETILVDDGDAIQGESLGLMSQGEAVVKLMNELRYDVAIPGNHEFDYGVDRFLELSKMAEFPYISCNFTKEGELLFDPYVIIERAGKKIAFVGATTPETITSSIPALFQDDQGNYIYGFMGDETGEALCEAVQGAVDAARAEGADFVYVLGHLGMEGTSEPWTYADVIEGTHGIDVLFDGHSHDTDQIVMKNDRGEDVTRSACGTKLACIGYSHISAEGEIVETGIWTWPNEVAAPVLLGIENDAGKEVDAALAELEEQLSVHVATTEHDLTIYDPEAVDAHGNPIRMVRRAETNMGDLVADGIRAQANADIGFSNGGGIRTDIPAGEITYGDIIAVQPFCNELCSIKATGQQILDALEWGARDLPAESGGFLQVSGMRYTIDLTVESTCVEDDEGMFAGVAGARRVRDAYVGDEPLDPNRVYIVAGTGYFLLDHGGGHTAFDGCEIVLNRVKLDNEALIDYVSETLGGVVGSEYADPYGQGRITIVQ